MPFIFLVCILLFYNILTIENANVRTKIMVTGPCAYSVFFLKNWLHRYTVTPGRLQPRTKCDWGISLLLKCRLKNLPFCCSYIVLSAIAVSKCDVMEIV